MATAPVLIPDSALDQDDAPEDDQHLITIHDRAMRRFDADFMPQMEQRALALLARRFASIPGAQWEGEWGEQFDNAIKVEINKVAVGLEKIERDYRENRIVPDFRPAGNSGDQETADTLDGMFRADAYHFKSQQAWDNAFQEGASGGMGAWRLTNELADPYDKDSDEQRINPAMIIVDADQRVFFDPNSKSYDKSDARYCFVLTAYSTDAFNEEFGEDRLASWPVGQRQIMYDWFRPSIVIVAEYYEKEDKTEKLLIFTHRLTNEEQRWFNSDIDADDIAELEAKGWVMRERMQKRCRIHKYTMSGAEVLRDNKYIAGSCIPVVPYYGKRWFIDNQERWRGYVQLMMDRQRVYNGQVSKLAETAALSPREKPIFAASQMPPHLATQWANQEIDRHPYALVEPLLDPVSGAIVTAGPIGNIQPPQLSPVTAALLQIANTDLTEDMADPDEVVANTSAAAMDIASTRVDAKSGIYLDNFAQSMKRGGEIYVSMCPDINHEQGREVETMDEEGADGTAILAEPYTDKTGKHGTRNDFTRGKYKVIVDITEATATRRDKTVKAGLAVAEKAVAVGDTELAQAALITAITNMDGEGMDDLKRFGRKKGLASGLFEPTEEEQQQMAEAAQGQQPDPTAKVLESQAIALQAQAGKNVAEAKHIEAKAGAVAADTAKTEADTELSRAKVIETMANAAETEHAAGIAEHQAHTKRLAALKPANDGQSAPPRQRISFGREMGGF